MTAVRARSLTLDFVSVVAFAAVTAMAAQLSVPLWPVPITLQTTAVLASGLLLGARRGALSQATYLAMGAAGMPVLAELKAGPFFLFPTGGYLLAFVLVAAMVGAARERWQGWRLGAAILGSNVVLLALGTAWLSLFLGKASWMTGFVPFLPGAVIQSLAAWAIYRAAKR